MTAPERIALRWELGAAVTSGPLMDHPDYTQYIRADLVGPAAIREAALRLMQLYDSAMDDLLGEEIHRNHPDSDEMAEIRRVLGAPALIQKGAADDRGPMLGTCACGMTGPCMWDKCKHPLAKGTTDDRA